MAHRRVVTVSEALASLFEEADEEFFGEEGGEGAGLAMHRDIDSDDDDADAGGLVCLLVSALTTTTFWTGLSILGDLLAPSLNDLTAEVDKKAERTTPATTTAMRTEQLVLRLAVQRTKMVSQQGT